MSSSSFLNVEITRGNSTESCHHVHAVISDSEGKIIKSWGDYKKSVYPRSAIKPIQAIPLIETGALDHFNLTNKEIALACASHSGEEEHVNIVTAWLTKIGCRLEDLECGIHKPSSSAAYKNLILNHKAPTALHNNCSGKHTGFLTTARYLNEDIKNYIHIDHPVQQRVLETLKKICGINSNQFAYGIDGCGIPVITIPLHNMAQAMAKFANPRNLEPAIAKAIQRITQAVSEYPVLTGGTEEFCTEVMKTTGKKAIIKVGAEGVYCGYLPEKGLGVALKVEDGAKRAAEAAMGYILNFLGVFSEEDKITLKNFLNPHIKSCAGKVVGNTIIT
ncbi:MAG: asparaginase [Alphaproteobacteria bacterium]|nr:asparaginase [Alphaproteobacteria bacterium]